MRRLAVLGAVALVAACAVEATYRGRLEVWNRTETPIQIIGRERNLVVPPCGHIVVDDFVLNRYFIADAEGRSVAWHGGGGSDPAHVLPAFEVVTAEGAIYSSAEPPQEPLPPCQGILEGQPGSNVENDRP